VKGRSIQALLDSGNEKELIDRFYKNLSFGTGGLRGILGAGDNRINIYNIRKATQGLANCVKKYHTGQTKPQVVITYDCRRFSDVFAYEAAKVLAGNQIVAFLTQSLRPTPFLSYAVRELKANAGIVITASHNPPEYNGFKVSWSDGGQVIPPFDEEIIHEVNHIQPEDVRIISSMESAQTQGLIQFVSTFVEEKFAETCAEQVMDQARLQSYSSKMKVVYTSLHGTGITMIPFVMEKLGVKNFFTVPEQEKPDGNFPTVKSPNPEDPEALEYAIRLAKEKNADLIIATDPDADRIGIGYPDHQGEFILPNGNQIASLLCYYKLSQLSLKGTDLSKGYLIKTIVTTDLIKAIADYYHVRTYEVLTGFKWIAKTIREKEEQGEFFIFGGEESFGYLSGSYCRDKDSVGISALLCDMCAYLKSRGISFSEYMDEMYDRFGYYCEALQSLTFKGKEGEDKISAIMETFRKEPIQELGSRKLIKSSDIESGVMYEQPSGKVIGNLDLPSSNVIALYYEGDLRIMLRPSGTEPKIKFYFGCKSCKTEQITVEQLKKQGGNELKEIVEAFMSIVQKQV